MRTNRQDDGSTLVGVAGENPDIVIAVPSNGDITMRWTFNLVGITNQIGLLGLRSGMIMSDRGDVAFARTRIVETALRLNASYIMWIDQDILVPIDVVPRLLSAEKRVVSGLYHMRGHPFDPVVYNLEPNRLNSQRYDIDLDGLNQVDSLGMGCVLVETGVYREMSKFFGDDLWYVLDPEVCEDGWFYRRLHDMGIPVYLDARVRCLHQTHTVVSTEDWLHLRGTVEEDHRTGRVKKD